MKSIKPGRAPSAMGVWGSVIAAVFGVFWIVTTIQIGAPWIFPAFGVLFIISAVAGGIYNYKNATSKNRYSTFDITEGGEEPDPLNKRFGEENVRYDAEQGDFREQAQPGTDGYCPYCGAPTEADYQYCRRCGKKLD
ncbi:MAG TPA: zinc ribbon domain-containing protein [Clostridia bacterium]|nr:zinc ribbon domain-containing protein [Clostridia bacterium]